MKLDGSDPLRGSCNGGDVNTAFGQGAGERGRRVDRGVGQEGRSSSLQSHHLAAPGWITGLPPQEQVIRRDIARTYPEHDFFKEKDGFGQESLFNVMKAYSLHDREVGYCQGSAFIVGLLLMQVNRLRLQMPEEEAFATFVRLMQEYRLREMFKPTMSELGLCMFQLETLVQELIPELHQHFQAQSFYTSMYASSWFLTLFTTSVSVSVASRIMDVFLLEGIEIVFRVAVAVLTTGRDKLLQQDMEGMLRYFQREMPEEFAADPDALFHVAFNIKYNAKKMKKLEKDYTVMKTKEQEDQVELRRLRMENRLLRQKSMMLERESAELADRLLQDQVNRANLQEDTFEINRELSMIRERDSITQLKLLQAEERIRKLSYMMEELVQQKEELIRLLQEELVKTRLKGAEDEATIKDLKEKVAELEEAQVNANYVRRAEEDVQACLEREESWSVREKEAEEQRRAQERRYADLESQMKEELMLGRIREAENSQKIAELTQKISSLEFRNQEMLVEEEIIRRPAESDSIKELQDKVSELKAEVSPVPFDLKLHEG
ncbi:unnamed protein product [Cyprideis torosa]|uniref:Uncharacterized protein n=1 Tax=Cyprideis torosa TaxID=163714 RepID=A0A7R8W798_9CRUS|nr:unnamed protein product [Cyprideis torosa]CAG0882168.1 unnamed protein product [Cyprideis torosa]